MSDIANGSYSITLGNSENAWVNGALVDNASGVKYKGQDVTGFSASTTDVGWTVTLTPPGGGSCTLVFTGGQYSAGPPKTITGGSVTGPCLAQGTPGDPGDTWSASASANEGEEHHHHHAGR